MKPVLIASGLVLMLSGAGAAAPASELPAHYFRLMEDAVAPLHGKADLTANNGAMLAAAVLYKKQHPANPSFGDKKNLDLALKLGDLAAANSEKDAAENKQDYEWEIHFWLDTYRLLGSRAGGRPPRRAGGSEIEKIVRWFAGEMAGRIDFPRYQGPYIRTSTNHLALFASTVYLAGRVLANKEWETLGARALHRLAAEEQTADGYWGEFTDNGPATGYNYLTMCCVALYWEHSRDTGGTGGPAAGHRLPQALHLARRHAGRDDQRPQSPLGGQRLGPLRLLALARRPPLRRVPRRLLHQGECQLPRRGPPRAERPLLSTKGRPRPFRRTCRRFAYQMKRCPPASARPGRGPSASPG